MEITSTTHIAAPIDRVWALTIDVERLPDHTPTITSVERLDQGPLALGSRARVKQPGQRPTVWTVTELEPTTRFAWSTKVATVTMAGIHDLRPAEDGTANTLSIEFSGFGSRLMSLLAGRIVRRAIETENDGLRAAAEQTEAEAH
ncbi:MAG: SRPBCC family protein [Acidimicrobiales bacterium]